MIKHMVINTPRGERIIGPGQPVFMIAEMSGNHNQDINRAYQIIDEAAKAGVDAIKLQTYTADTITIDSNLPWFQITEGPWAGKNLYQLYQSAYTPWEWQPKLKEYAEGKGLVVFSTPFDATAVDFLESMQVPLYKVASFETGDLQLLERIGQTKKPVIISRGMTSESDLQLALDTLRSAGCPSIAVLHCVSAYPAVAEEMNLSTIPDIVQKFGVVSGLSDHTLGNTAAITSVGLGGSIIEKHVTLKRSDGGPDAAFSLEPQELAALVVAVREAQLAIGIPTYGVTEDEKTSVVFRRSLFVVKDIKAGEILTNENVRSIRPGNGMEPKHLKEIIGTVAKKDIARGTPLTQELIG